MQTPRSILLHIDSSARTRERIQVARQLSEEFEAEVHAVPCTLSALLQYPFAIDGAAAAVAIMQELEESARAGMRRVFMAEAKGARRLHWAEPLNDMPWGLARRALYSDLLLLGQHNAEDPAARELPDAFIPSLLADSGRPALILPFAGAIRPIGQTVLIAWKETRESAHALSASLPWLRTARRVHAVSYGEDASASLQCLQSYLKAQGIGTTLYPMQRDEGDAGENLLSLAADCNADLLVMGCYGHSRAREWALGGATRTVLQSMTLPVLMAH